MITSVFSIPFDDPETAPAERRDLGWPLREFIGDVSNRLALEAANAVLSNQCRYNPIVFCGPSGVGKTHLCRGLLRCWKGRHPNLRSVSLSGSEFARLYREAVDADDVAEFRRKLRSARLLLLDNLEEMLDKLPAQEELLNLVDTLCNREAQLLVTTRRIPITLETLLPGLASRFASGLVVSLPAPGPAARREILRRLVQIHHVRVNEETVDLLATELRPPVHQVLAPPLLNHAVIQLVAAHGKGPIGCDDVRKFIEQHNQIHTPSLKTITTSVCRYYKLKLTDVRGTARRSQLVRARGMAMYLARELIGMSFNRIGQYFSGRDHTTVMHAVRKTERLLLQEADFQRAARDIREQLVPDRNEAISKPEQGDLRSANVARSEPGHNARSTGHNQ